MNFKIGDRVVISTETSILGLSKLNGEHGIIDGIDDDDAVWPFRVRLDKVSPNVDHDVWMSYEDIELEVVSLVKKIDNAIIAALPGAKWRLNE